MALQSPKTALGQELWCHVACPLLHWRASLWHRGRCQHSRSSSTPLHRHHEVLSTWVPDSSGSSCRRRDVLTHTWQMRRMTFIGVEWFTHFSSLSSTISCPQSEDPIFLLFVGSDHFNVCLESLWWIGNKERKHRRVSFALFFNFIDER